jgi:hypothetical protein
MIGGFGLSKIIEVTADALGRQSLTVERAYRSNLVTGITVHSGVRSDEREAVLVLIDVVNGDLPSRVAMAHIALRPVLAPVDIGVAILALLAYVGEYQVGMTVRAASFAVHAAQREPCLLVIKLRNRPDRLPALGAVAVLTGDTQASVRTMRLSIGGNRWFISSR